MMLHVSHLRVSEPGEELRPGHGHPDQAAEAAGGEGREQPGQRPQDGSQTHQDGAGRSL